MVSAISRSRRDPCECYPLNLSVPSLTARKDYLTDVAQKYRLYKHARFHSTVNGAHWNDKTLKWEVDVSVGGGKDSEFTSSYKVTTDFLVAATGQLNKPKGITVAGYNDYQGKIMHSARWDWSYDMSGKRIAVIGTGKLIRAGYF